MSAAATPVATGSGIVIAPFSNSAIRDWPGRHYGALIALLLDSTAGTEPIRIIGTRNHIFRSREIVRGFRSDRVVNLCGTLSWAGMVAVIRSATCMIANNSGAAHLGGHFGVPTVCIFAGTHQRREWRPLGSNVLVVSQAIGCAPCQRDHGQISPYDKACLRGIAPETVAAAVSTVLARRGTVGGARPVLGDD